MASRTTDELSVEELTEYIKLRKEFRSRNNNISCPRPDLIDKIICKEFHSKYYFGRVKYWDSKVGQFFVSYEDYDSEHMTETEIEEYKLTKQNCFAWIEQSGGRHKSFGKCLRILTNNKKSLVRRAYRSLGLEVDEDHPWPCLGSNEVEKVLNAEKVIEYLFNN
jgi:hypothetical protein